MAETQTHGEWTRAELHRLLFLAAGLADLTTSFDLLERVPLFLVDRLPAGSVAMGIIKLRDSGAEVVQFAQAPAATGPAAETARQRLAQEYQRAAARSGTDLGGTASKSITFNAEAGEVVVCRDIDRVSKLILIVSHKGGEAPSAMALFTIDLVASNLVAQISSMLAWMNDVSVLGSPFDRLTDREWVVLQGLQSEDGEKQVADRLELSPHTLHSHIKSIYRKLGVQGRLPVLMRLGAAQRALRLRMAADRLLSANSPGQ